MGCETFHDTGRAWTPLELQLMSRLSSQDCVVWDAWRLLPDVRMALEEYGYAYVEIRCCDRGEVEIFKRIFAERLDPDLTKRVVYSWLERREVT